MAAGAPEAASAPGTPASGDSVDPGAGARAAAEASTPRVRRKGGKPRLRRNLSSFQDLPDYLKDNEFITHGYRSNLSFRQSLGSLFSLHNETGNVWSHLLGALFFIMLSVWVYNRAPTPLAVNDLHVDELWDRLQGSAWEVRQNVALVAGKLSSQLSLTDERVMAMREQLSQLQHSLAHTVSDVALSVSDTVSDVGDSLSAKAHSLGDGLQHVSADVMRTVSGTVLDVKDRVATEGAVAAAQHTLEDGMAVAALQLATLRSYVNETITAHLHGAHEQRLQWPTARWPMYLFMAGAVICMATSSVCHLLGAMTQKYVSKVWKYDYAGIVCLIVSSFYPVIWYGFLCMPITRNFHLAVITLLGCATLCFTLFNRFQTQRFRSTRAFLFAVLGLWGVVPLLHNLIINWHIHQIRIISVYEILMGAWYLGGATIFAWRVPERLAPGRFDRWGHSHQIFHIFVVLGALTHYHAAGLALQWRDASGGCAAPVSHPVHEALNATGMTQEQVWDALWLRTRTYSGLDQLDSLCQTDAEGICTWAEAPAPILG